MNKVEKKKKWEKKGIVISLEHSLNKTTAISKLLGLNMQII